MGLLILDAVHLVRRAVVRIVVPVVVQAGLGARPSPPLRRVGTAGKASADGARGKRHSAASRGGRRWHEVILRARFLAVQLLLVAHPGARSSAPAGFSEWGSLRFERGETGSRRRRGARSAGVQSSCGLGSGQLRTMRALCGHAGRTRKLSGGERTAGNPTASLSRER